MKQFQENNLNPAISVGKDGTVLYSNEVSETLLHEWGMTVGEKLPSSVVDIVQKEINQKCVNIFGVNTSSSYKDLEEKLQESEAREVANLELADILDIPAIKSLMDDLHELTHVVIALVDLKGNVLIGVGWQDICTQFHRVHPETCKNCIESDT
ncbi:MAG: PocR ligand-binding domain-containing protein, partial [Methanosarcina vacuolata]|nr:PocR ligand-binding domain-containing protein [Methanosarcina vacuolata]